MGSWIRKDTAIRDKNKKFYFGGYLTACSILAISAICILAFTKWSLEVLFAYNNPLVVIAAVALFIFFTKISIKSIWINKLAPTVVAALFIQQIQFWYFSPYFYSRPVYYIPLYIIAIFLIAFIVEYPRKKWTESLLSYLSRKKSGTFIQRSIFS